MFVIWYQYRQVSGIRSFPTLDAASDFVTDLLVRCPRASFSRA